MLGAMKPLFTGAAIALASGRTRAGDISTMRVKTRRSSSGGICEPSAKCRKVE